MVTSSELLQKKCRHQENALDDAAVAQHLSAVEGWSLEEGKIVKSFAFKNYYRTMAFVNALAYIMHSEDHHPDLLVSYNRCVVKFNTHSVNGGKGGLSENDFICAAKVDNLFRQGPA